MSGVEIPVCGNFSRQISARGQELNMADKRTIRTMCPMNCHPTLCGMQVTVEDNKLIDIKGDKENPDSQGFLCVRGQAAKEIIGNPERILYPMMREQRGSDDWRRVSWDEALEHIVEKMQSVGREAVALWPGHGSVANDFGTFVHVQLTTRFANMYGCQRWEPSMICWGLGGFGAALTGAMEANTKEEMGANADMVLLWGTNIASQPNSSRYITAAKKRGARIIAIDVRVSEACKIANEYLFGKPGSDSALALAMMHVIVNENLHDTDFVSQYTVGFDELHAHLQSCTPEWAETVTGIAAERIVQLAREYANTERAILMMSGSSMYKNQSGWQASRAITCLPPLTGKLGKPGAGFGPRHAAAAHGSGWETTTNIEARPPGNYIPNQMSAIIDAFDAGRIRALLLFGTNMLSSFADVKRIENGIANMELVVSHDLFMNETARRHADVLLPATAWLEDVGCKATATHIYVTEQALEPAGEARSMASIVRALAERLDVQDFYPWDTDTGHIDAVLDHPATGHATVASLREQGGIGTLDVSPVAHLDHRYCTPSGKIEFYSSLAEDHGLPPLPVYEARPESKFPLELRTGRTLNHFHAFYDHGRALPSLNKLEKGPVVWIATDDATSRSINDGDKVRIHNDRGECDASAKVTNDVPSGTLWMHDGWMGLNTLTSGDACLPDSVVDVFGFTTGQSAYDAMVEVTPG